MPVTSLDQAQKREAQIKQALAGLGEAPDVAKKREFGKKLRRAQRLRRRLLTEAERTGKADAKASAKAEAAKAAPEPAPAGAAPAEAAPAKDAAPEKAAE